MNPSSFETGDVFYSGAFTKSESPVFPTLLRAEPTGVSLKGCPKRRAQHVYNPTGGTVAAHIRPDHAVHAAGAAWSEEGLNSAQASWWNDLSEDILLYSGSVYCFFG